ncbi:hypothetical protein LCGC14_1436400 [marine sediment metagenome]|uniref:Uncharacterized protein n=1 Tax=marine sediment metagenome TaxID=412755 RepID=A0A0F9JM34_9ZZZZ
MTANCFVCGKELISDIQKIDDEITVHTLCFKRFKVLVSAVYGGTTPKREGILKLVEIIEGEPILTYRKMPTNIHPLLVYLAFQDEPIPPSKFYEWIKKNELKIKNPPQYIGKGIDKGWIAPFKTKEGRVIKITTAGLNEVENLAKRIS